MRHRSTEIRRPDGTSTPLESADTLCAETFPHYAEQSARITQSSMLDRVHLVTPTICYEIIGIYRCFCEYPRNEIGAHSRLGHLPDAGFGGRSQECAFVGSILPQWPGSLSIPRLPLQRQGPLRSVPSKLPPLFDFRCSEFIVTGRHHRSSRGRSRTR
jgi:hypothetical protein